MPNPFVPIDLKSTIDVRRMYTMYYFCFASGHVFPGEEHDFWELVYVDSGELDVTAGQTELVVGQGKLILHPPNEFHRFMVTRDHSSLFVTGFESDSPELFRLCKGSIPLNHVEKRLLSSLCRESEQCYGPAMDSANLIQLCPQANAPIASIQMIRLYLEQLFILLLRDEQQQRISGTQNGFITDAQNQENLFRQIVSFMGMHLDGGLSFETIRAQFNMSATSLKNLFAGQAGMGVIEYYQRMRIDEARRLLRIGTMNITQTAEHLGYSSIHTFSRQFRRLMGMSPTEYLKSIHYIPI
ncbi:MAG: AraC family transcriptional regulator [Eubacteriales bacterium]|nr:AraC family transcriptional regulator [bacterium]MDY2792365.1 AraC family transcriptional regulator [Eubacteriales bacterium]